MALIAAHLNAGVIPVAVAGDSVADTVYNFRAPFYPSLISLINIMAWVKNHYLLH